MSRTSLLLGLFLVGTSGCFSTHGPCDQLNACPGALVCQVGRCTSVESIPVRAETSRLVLEPTDMLFLDGASQENTLSDLRAATPVGGGSLVLLRFEPTWQAQQIERADLLLDPAEDAFSQPESMEVLVSPILSEWTSQSPTRLPYVGQPRARAIVPFAPPRQVRINITELIQNWAQNRQTIHGVALRWMPGNNLGARFAWGTLSGTNPRLDIYLR